MTLNHGSLLNSIIVSGGTDAMKSILCAYGTLKFPFIDCSAEKQMLYANTQQ